MTPPAPIAPDALADLHAAAAAVVLAVLSSATWPETDTDVKVPALPGFVESNFSPLLAEVAGRALRGRDQPPAPGTVTAFVIVTALGDVTSATTVGSSRTASPGQLAFCPHQRLGSGG